MHDLSDYMNSEVRLKGKRILLLSPAFFDIETNIKNNFERLGATVDFFDERSIKSALNRAILKISPLIFTFTTEKYYESILKEIKSNRYDFILVVRCDMISRDILQKIKCKFPSAKLCLYLWDPIKTIKGLNKKLPLFDRISSFDRNDCRDYPQIFFRPLYCTQNVSKVIDPVSEFKYDFAFYGTIHSDRLEVLRKIELFCKKNNYSFYKYYYLPSEFMYYFYKITRKSFRFYNKTDFEFSKISSEQIMDIDSQSHIIIDIQHPKQVGLTSRTINRICSMKKIVTTDEDIVNYDFYNPNNIYVINRRSPKLDKRILDGQSVLINNEILERYSFEAWAKDVLGL